VPVQPFSAAFALTTPFGPCAAVRLPPAGQADLGMALLHPDERTHASALAPLRRVTWVGGRIALRSALRSLRPSFDAPLLATPRGAPQLPPGITGSISHKRSLAIALAATADHGWVGVDLEDLGRRPSDIARLVLVEQELAAIAHLAPAERWRAMLLRFSIKESVYKAIDPFLQRYVGFSEASVELGASGSASVRLALKDRAGPCDVEAWWTEVDDAIVTAVRVRRGGSVSPG